MRRAGSRTGFMKRRIIIQNQCSWEKVAPAYHSLVKESVAAYQSILGDKIVDIRLLGSVARGDAVMRESDIDFLAILRSSPSPEQTAALVEKSGILEKRFPVVSQAGLDVILEENLPEYRNFVFATDSLHLSGTDKYPDGRREMDSQYLADLVTPDINEVLPMYCRCVEKTEEDKFRLIFQYCRWSGKDILKCLRGDAIRKKGIYERTIARIHEQLLRLYPENASLLDRIYALYNSPVSDKPHILAVLRSVEGIFSATHNTKGI